MKLVEIDKIENGLMKKIEILKDNMETGLEKLIKDDETKEKKLIAEMQVLEIYICQIDRGAWKIEYQMEDSIYSEWLKVKEDLYGIYGLLCKLETGYAMITENK
ncbi:MAG: hypothetical protein RSD63_09945 [Eubacterium sp.]